jgi:hypothetical protein
MIGKGAVFQPRSYSWQLAREDRKGASWAMRDMLAGKSLECVPEIYPRLTRLLRPFGHKMLLGPAETRKYGRDGKNI